MRRILRSFLFLCILLFFVSCPRHKAASPAEQKSNSGILIVATFYPIYIMCLNIISGIDGINLSLLAPSDTGCLHDYSLTSRDAKTLEDADIIVANGAGMETFLGQTLKTFNEKTIVASDGYPLSNGNPHIFVSLAGARSEVSAIANGLSRHDGAHAAEYLDNAKRYDEELASLSEEMHHALAPFKGKNIVTFHEAFPYFADEFGFNILSVIEREPGTVPSAKEMAYILSIIKKEIAAGNSPALFAEPQYPSAPANIIKKETGLSVHNLDPCVTGEMAQNAYILAQRENLRSLLDAFFR